MPDDGSGAGGASGGADDIASSVNSAAGAAGAGDTRGRHGSHTLHGLRGPRGLRARFALGRSASDGTVWNPAVLLAGLAALVAAAALADTALVGLLLPGAALAFAAVIAVGEATVVELPGGRPCAPLALAATFGYAFTMTVARTPAAFGPAQVVAVVVVGLAAGAAVQTLGGRPPHRRYLARRVLETAVVAVAFRGPPVSTAVHGLLARGEMPQLCLILAACSAFGTFWVHALSALFTLVDPPRGRTGPRPAASINRRRLGTAFADECRALVWVCPTSGAFGVATALTERALGLWALPIVAAPLVAVQRSLRRYAAVGATYQQTIRALSHVTELAGYTAPGHASRVCRLALAIGRDLGLGESQLRDLEYAALLHDIGQLSLTDPIGRGATTLIGPRQAQSIATLGAEVVRQTGVLSRVADIIGCQREPYRPERAAEPAALAGGIIRVANAYDDLVGAHADPARVRDTLNRLLADAGTEYDPGAVKALARLAGPVVPQPAAR